MPGKGDIKMPCGRQDYCGRTTCQNTEHCIRLEGERAARDDAARAAQRARVRPEGGHHTQGAPARQKRPLAEPADVVYLYDGSLPGLYCCVHESVYSRQLPCGIWPEHEAQPTLYAQKLIETDMEKAARVRASVGAKISPRALELAETVFLSCLAEKEIKTLRFLLLGYQRGRDVTEMLGHPDVAPLMAAEKHLGGEAHLLKGFIRFSDYDGVLAATISPKNFVLPFLAGHFVNRYSCEQFIVYDKTHKAALIYENRRHRIVPMEGIQFPEADETEQQYRALWKRFYNTIAIEARYNPKCRMTHMPKRYWENMLEVADLLEKPPVTVAMDRAKNAAALPAAK